MNFYKLSSTALIFFIYCLANQLFAQIKTSISDSAIIVRVADNILSTTTYDFMIVDENKTLSKLEVSTIRESLRQRSPYNEWAYWNGVLNISMLRIADTFKEKKYKDFAVKNYELAFNSLPILKEYKGKKKWYFPYETLVKTERLDDCGAIGAGLIEVNQITPRKDYVAYIQNAGNHILNIQSRLKDGTLARDDPNKMTVWGDDLYMSIVFMSRMGKWTGNNRYHDDAIKQIENFTKYLFDKNAEIYYHAWFDDLKVNGVAHWGRCNGWIMMAQIELLDHLSINHPKRNTLIKILQQQIIGLSRYQDISGMWHQLIDKNDSYLETSSTAMFTYSIAKAINMGWIDKRYISIALNGWQGVQRNIQEDGQVKNICMGTGIENDIAFYYNRPAPLNDIHGLGAIILAGNEIIKYKKNNPNIETK
jgi:unsaturated rhamnogalacturonyl hydrolase